MSSNPFQHWTPAQVAAHNAKVQSNRFIRVVPHTDPAPVVQQKGFRSGWRTIGGQRIYARSRWEANYARYLQFQQDHKLIKRWQHEPDTFWFKDIKRGVCSYLPDFKVFNNDSTIEYREVKGFFDNKSKTKLRRMAKYHPTVKVVLVDSVWYKTNSKQLAGLIPGWEK